MSDLLKLLFINRPDKSFQLERQLMANFHHKSRFLRKFFQRRIYYKYHCDISPTATIHHSVTFPHPIAIIIGSNVTIYENCIIYQNVTIGSNFQGNNCMPKIHANTKIGTGAKLLGDITIGENCIIGANSVITKSIPPNSIVVGINSIIGKVK